VLELAWARTRAVTLGLPTLRQPNHPNVLFPWARVAATLQGGICAGVGPDRGNVMSSDSSDELKDDVLHAEIQLLGQLVLAVSAVTRHLTPEEVDQLLDAQ
jgi:hypothetical protein